MFAMKAIDEGNDGATFAAIVTTTDTVDTSLSLILSLQCETDSLCIAGPRCRPRKTPTGRNGSPVIAKATTHRPREATMERRARTLPRVKRASRLLHCERQPPRRERRWSCAGSENKKKTTNLAHTKQGEPARRTRQKRAKANYIYEETRKGESSRGPSL